MYARVNSRKFKKELSSFVKLEPQRVSKDANKVLDMMNKDYTGGSASGPNPRHKPPINNHESLDNGRVPINGNTVGLRQGVPSSALLNFRRDDVI
nr:uncharacterized protein LOC109184085 isoform X3 [Ipomoea batatas]